MIFTGTARNIGRIIAGAAESVTIAGAEASYAPILMDRKVRANFQHPAVLSHLRALHQVSNALCINSYTCASSHSFGIELQSVII